MELCDPSDRRSLKVMIKANLNNAELTLIIENIRYLLPSLVCRTTQYEGATAWHIIVTNCKSCNPLNHHDDTVIT